MFAVDEDVRPASGGRSSLCGRADIAALLVLSPSAAIAAKASAMKAPRIKVYLQLELIHPPSRH
jgi:hypothetical protein